MRIKVEFGKQQYIKKSKLLVHYILKSTIKQEQCGQNSTLGNSTINVVQI